MLREDVGAERPSDPLGRCIAQPVVRAKFVSAPIAVRWYGLAVLVIVPTSSANGSPGHLQFGETIYVAPFWNWVLTYNPGAAFSFLADQPGWQRWFFHPGLSAFRLDRGELRQHAGDRLLAFALAPHHGRRPGNVIDRIRFGAVVDFVQWHAAGFYWLAFNVADSAITVGAVRCFSSGSNCFPGGKAAQGPNP